MNSQRDSTFLTRHAWDKWFWATFITVCVVSVLLGFREPVTKRFTGLSEYEAPLALQIHVWSFSAWFVFLGLQAYLTASGAISRHRKLGRLLIPLVTIMTISALFAEFHSKRFYADIYPYQLEILASTLTEIACFAVPATLAFLYRKKADVHKRLIFLATAVLATAAMRRIYAPIAYDLVEPSFWVSLMIEPLGLYLLIAGAALFDFMTRSKIHATLIKGGGIILLANWLALYVGETEVWTRFAAKLIGG